MGKIRPQFGDDVVHGLAQWVGRKLRNHDPLSTVDGNRTTALAVKKSYRTVHSDGDAKAGQVYCGLVKTDMRLVRYGLADGRVFQIAIREVTPDEEPVELLEVGA
jgi:hypothetical protein